MSSIYSQYARSSSPSSTLPTQAEPIPGRESEMKLNNAGGFAFKLDKWSVLDRFLLIGSEQSSYYASQQDITKQGFDTIKACIAEDGVRVVRHALEYSLTGRSPKNDTSVVAIALAAVYGNAATIEAAYDALPKVARTGTWLFLFVSILDALGKWNAAAKRGIAKWYNDKDIQRLAVQLLKYKSRNGWAHRDVLRLSHTKPTSPEQEALLGYAVGKKSNLEALPKLVQDFETLKTSSSREEVLRIISDNKDITWEMVPTKWMTDKDVLSALLVNMGLTAVIRKLGILTSHGVLTPLSEGSNLIISKLSNTHALRDQRVHPLTLLQAIRQYSAGQGEKSKAKWKPNQRIVDALDDAFYAAFEQGEKSDEAYLLGVDCSASMFGVKVNGSPNLSAAEVAAVMALAVVKNHSNYWIGGFNTKMSELHISPNMRLDAVLKKMQKFNWGGTDLSLPATHALENRMKVDTFVSITDNETWAGQIHATDALKQYRRKMDTPKTRQVIIATSVTDVSVSDPNDPLQLDIAGFDSAAPQIISQFGKKF